MPKQLPYKLAAIDLDETLLGHDKRVSEENLRALNFLRSSAIIPVLASGRRHDNMVMFHRALGLAGYIISAQGAMAKHGETGEILYDATLPPALSARIIAEGLSRGATVVCYHAQAVFAEGNPDRIQEYSRLAGDPVEVRPLHTLADERLEKVIWMADTPAVEEWRITMGRAYEGLADTVITEPTFLEFTHRGVNKGSALAAVANHLGIAADEVLAFGDGNNDVGMLGWAGLGVAMDHGKESAKAAADLVTAPGEPATGFARGVDAVLARHGLPALNVPGRRR